jgi:two-component system, OmpR family, KDP operon response regulator KdpE
MDDDPAIGRLLRVLLEGERYKVLWRRSGAEGLAEGVESRPDVFILELDLPDGDGLEVLRALRQWSDAPVMILSARAAVQDVVRALDAGANDFMVKPFAPEELAARLRVLLRSEPPACDGPLLVSGALRIDMASREMTVNGIPLMLTATEEAVMLILARHAGKIVPRGHLVNAVWGAPEPRKVHDLQVHVARLRRKLEESGANNLIQDAEGIGYTLAPAADHGVLVGK